MNIEGEVEITRNLINNAIMKYLPLKSKTLPYPFIKHIIKAPGKRIRASVLIWSCESVGGQPTLALPIAVAYEFGHTASLIQDDLMDRSLLRRSVVPVHIKWGQDAAILSSDVLVFHIFNILSEMALKDFPKEVLS